jgi:hypothetical protein
MKYSLLHEYLEHSHFISALVEPRIFAFRRVSWRRRDLASPNAVARSSAESYISCYARIYLRAITTATAAAVLSVDRKSLDNLLSRIGADLLLTGRQGVERKIPVEALEDIALTAELVDRLTIPIREAFSLARRLLGRDALDLTTARDAEPEFVGSLNLGPFIHLGVDLQALRAELHARLEIAIESHVRPRRGRPPRDRDSRPVLSADVGDA